MILLVKSKRVDLIQITFKIFDLYNLTKTIIILLIIKHRENFNYILNHEFIYIFDTSINIREVPMIY